MPLESPKPGDVTITQSGNSLFIHRITAAGTDDWYATSSTFKRERGVSLTGRQGSEQAKEGNWKACPDFSTGRCEKGEARALIRKYLPELLTETNRVFFYTCGAYHISTKDEVSGRARPTRSAEEPAIGQHHPAPLHRL